MAKKAAASRKLTPKQETFVAEYVIDWNANAAARRAGYSEGTAKNAAVSLIERNPHVKAAIEKKRSELNRQSEMTQEELIRILDRMIWAKIDDFEEGDTDSPFTVKESVDPLAMHAVAQIKKRIIRGSKGEDRVWLEGIEWKLHNKVELIKLRAKIFGMITDKQQIDVTVEFKKMIQEAAGEYRGKLARIAERKKLPADAK